jgi:hypothetical protein
MSGKIDNLKPFPKGVSGNPGGKTKQDLEIEAFARLNAKLALDTLIEAMTKAPLMSDRINAAKQVLERAYGKPKETVTVTHERPVSEWTEEQLDAAIANLAGEEGKGKGAKVSH